MLRALFILLAVVSFVLGIVLQQFVLYVAAAVLLLVAVVMLVFAAKKRHEKSKKSYLATARDQDEELAALGIADIRPRERDRTRSTEPNQVDAEEPATPPSRFEAPDERAAGDSVTEPGVGDGNGESARGAGTGERSNEDLRALGIMEIRPRQRRTVDSPGESVPQGDGGGVMPPTGAPAGDSETTIAPALSDSLRRDVLAPYLQSAQSAIGANTLCLLRHDPDALKYHIESIVSKNAYARSQGHFRSRVPLLKPAAARRPILTFRIGEKGIAAANLGYYLEPIAVRQIAIAAIPGGESGPTFFLLADSMEEDGLSSARQHTLMSQFARGLGTILSGEAQPDLAAEADLFRPRREIIAEEMARARNAHDPLALILVYLNEAEEIAAEGEEEVHNAEAVLEERLRNAVGERRVEHFGELVYGVFDNGPTADVEPWVMQLQEQLIAESGPLSAGVSIGIAVMKDRHQDPDAFRADANAALKEAFETGACTILE